MLIEAAELLKLEKVIEVHLLRKVSKFFTVPPEGSTRETLHMSTPEYHKSKVEHTQSNVPTRQLILQSAGEDLADALDPRKIKVSIAGFHGVRVLWDESDEDTLKFKVDVLVDTWTAHN